MPAANAVVEDSKVQSDAAAMKASPLVAVVAVSPLVQGVIPSALLALMVDVLVEAFLSALAPMLVCLSALASSCL
jgi:hypothetical protein